MLSYNFAKAAGRMTRVFLWIVLTGVILAFSFISYNRTKVWKDPVSLFSDVIAKDRSGAEVSMGYYNRGNEYLRLQEPNLALSDYSQAIKVFPGYTEAYYNRGLVNFKIHDYQTAADDFSMAISLRNNFTQAYLNRGTVYRSMRKYPLALEDFNRAIEIQPSGVAYFSRGALLYFNFNEIDLGCDDWNESLRLGYEPARELLEKYCL